MFIRALRIQNFRAIEDIHLTTSGSPNAVVIAGPNAVGKSTVLEAVRLVKALLAPTFRGEPEMTLRDMGVMSPHSGSIDGEQLFKDPARPLEVEVRFDLRDEELVFLAEAVNQWAHRRVANELAVQADNLQLALIQFLSSTQGRSALDRARSEIRSGLQPIEATKSVTLGLTIDSKSGINGTRLFDQEAFALLSARDSGRLGLLSYFPADRAMPSGEVNIQLGTADLNQQVHSHVAQPATKYNRLKQYLVNRFLLGAAQREELKADFQLVFERLLRDKALDGIQLSDSGRLAVSISDRATGARYDIDRMSSGEKGLVLTLLLMKRTTMQGGVVLMDEPELHLNSSVCRELLPFIIQDILKPASLQAIICTHSEELLASAYSREDCNLFHLRSGRDISRIELQDRQELEGALRALGSSSVDVLFSNGTLYVEGPDDKRLLEDGFSSRVARWRIVPLGGRQEVEKQISQLQRVEQQGQLEGIHAFIFDRDRRPSLVTDSAHVHVQQWDRYCLENYLLDADSIYDALRRIPRDEDVELTRGSLSQLLREFAMSQLPQVATRRAYAEIEPENAGIRPSDFSDGDDFRAVGQLLSERLARIRDKLKEFDQHQWITDFVSVAEEASVRLKAEWANDWQRYANGKVVLERVHSHFRIRIDRSEFKSRVARALHARSAESWKVVDSTLSALLRFQ